MALYSLLRDMAIKLAMLRGYVNGYANVFDDVFLLKDTVAPLLYNLSNVLAQMVRGVEDLSAAFLVFRDEITSGVGNNSILGDLLYYADVILGIARDPEYFIKQAIKIYLPDLYDFSNDARTYIENVVINFVGGAIDFLRNPHALINDAINNAIGGARLLLDNPREYIINSIFDLSHDVRSILNDPRGFIINEVLTSFPDVKYFIIDPQSYILDKMINGLELFWDKHSARLSKIAEHILNKIF